MTAENEQEFPRAPVERLVMRCDNCQYRNKENMRWPCKFTNAGATFGKPMPPRDLGGCIYFEREV
jgi:hypothetical protein